MRCERGFGGGGCLIGCGVGALLMLFIPLLLAGWGRDADLVKPGGRFAGVNCAGAIDFVKDAKYLPWVAESATRYLQGDQAILIALIQTESSWNPKAGAGTSSAAGLGQFITSTARGYKEFVGGNDGHGTTWPAGTVYDNPDTNSDDARFDPQRSIFAAGRKFGNDMKRFNNDPVQAYMKGYHTYKNEEQRIYAQRGADRMMEAYRKLKSSGNCDNTASIASATPFDCNGKKFVFPIVAAKVNYGKTHHDYSATDMFADEGQPVVSITDGSVASINKTERGDGGVTVRIIDRDNLSYYYAHLQAGSNRHLRVGSTVKAGEQIGRVGKTGNARSTPPHLHLGIAKREGPQHKGYYPSQHIDNTNFSSDWPSNKKPLDAWKKGECADPRT